MAVPDEDPIHSLDIFLTAGEAFPALEKLFLEARREVLCGFRIFDLDTNLRSADAKAVGETWFDLFEHTLARGVNITLVLSDFDPIVATDYHRKSWKSAQQLAAAEEVSGRGKLDFRIARHPARAGVVPRLLLRNRVREKFRKLDADHYTPGLADLSEDDLFELAPATHHQKLAVFDGEKLYIGGLDLDERRFDTTDHERPAEETWQDVQVLVTGPVVAAAKRHLETFEAVVDGRRSPEASSPGFLRTMSKKRKPAIFFISPRSVVTELEDMHLKAISRSRELIYLETQFLRHQPLADAIAGAGAKVPDLRLIVVLPAAPEDVAFKEDAGQDARMGEHLQAEAVGTLRDTFGERALFCSPAQKRPVAATKGRDALQRSPIIYVHSKVSIFDRSEAIVSSANLNGRSMKWDTEAGLHLTKDAHVSQLRTRILNHWVPSASPDAEDQSDALFHRWRDTVLADGSRSPSERVSNLLPYDHDAAREIGEAVPLVPNELV